MLLWIGRVKRDINSPSFQNGQQGDQQSRRTLKADTNRYLWPNTDFPEIGSQLISLLIYFCIGQILILKIDSHCLRIPLNLFLKDLRQTAIQWIRLCSGIPLPYLSGLLRQHKLIVHERLVRISYNLLQYTDV